MTGLVRMVLVMVAALLLAAPVPADEADVDVAIEAGRGSAETFRAAFSVLQAAVAAGDAETVASLVNYPVPVFLGDTRTIVRSDTDFVARYSEILTGSLARIIAQQAYGALTLDGELVVFDGGAVRMRPYCTDTSCAASYWLIVELRADRD